MQENLQIWDKLKTPPPWAKKEIGAGRLKGMTDINPQWRLMAMTEQFGPCGIGWKYTIDKQWTEKGAGEEVCAFTNVSLYFKHDGQWSDAIPGNGGSALVAKEKAGPYTSDECFKMSLTDALSVAMKAIGVGAEIYCGSKFFPTKYEKTETADKPGTTTPPTTAATPPPVPTNTGALKKELLDYHLGKVEDAAAMLKELSTFTGTDKVEKWATWDKIDTISAKWEASILAAFYKLHPKVSE